MLELFPGRYHEPYTASYRDEDFAAVAGDCGLVPTAGRIAFLSKVMTFDKEREARRGRRRKSGLGADVV